MTSLDGQQNIEERGGEREDDQGGEKRGRDGWIVSGRMELKWIWSWQQTELDIGQ